MLVGRRRLYGLFYSPTPAQIVVLALVDLRQNPEVMKAYLRSTGILAIVFGISLAVKLVNRIGSGLLRPLRLWMAVSLEPRRHLYTRSPTEMLTQTLVVDLFPFLRQHF